MSPANGRVVLDWPPIVKPAPIVPGAAVLFVGV